MENSSLALKEAPPLADSDFELWTEYMADYISVWLQNSAEFIQEQRQKLLQMALCPFLYGVTQGLPEAWIEILHTYGIIEKEREHKTSPMSEVELESLDMAEMIFVCCSQLVDNKSDLKTILNFIHDVEEKSALGKHIDMSYALHEVANLELFSSMWASMRRLYDKRKKQAHVCIIYYFKLISHHIILYGRDGTDNLDFVKKTISDIHKADGKKSGKGNKAFNDKDFKLAVDQYSAEIEKDPFNSLLYSNRAQAYINLCHYRSALCDSKRAVILDPKNSKHYFRAAKSCLELGQLKKAEELNLQSLKFCSDPLQIEAVQQQSREIQAKSKMTKVSSNTITSGSEEQELEMNYQRFVSEGSNLYLSSFFSRAVEQFKNAMDLLSRPGDQGVMVEDSDLMVLWYAYGMSCVKTVNLHNLQIAVEKFSSIISRTEAYPAAYYGLGLAFISLKRFKDAEGVLSSGLEIVSKLEGSLRYTWPRTNKIIEETDISTLRTLMKDLLKECAYPPKPDAICKFHINGDNSKKEIYLSDPDYKGHIRLECGADCAVEFHTTCWKLNETLAKGKHNWKEMLDNPCPTPGCWGLVCVVYICRPYPEKSLKMKSQLPPQPKTTQPRPKLKMKSESVSKLERRLEKKVQRKEKRQEARQQIQELQASMEEQSQNKIVTISEPLIAPEVASRNIDQSVTVLHREEPEIPSEKRQKANKTKKKEKKQKQFITLDLQFKGDENKERYGIHSLDDNGEFVIRPPTTVSPVSMPAPGVEPEQTPAADTAQQPNLDLRDNAVYEFIYNILIAKGPMDIFGKEFETHLRFLCEEAQARIHARGGLTSFLKSSPRFVFLPNNVVNIAAFPVHHKSPQVSPWENKSGSSKPVDSSLAWTRLRYGLNPGAKEFFPQDATAPASAEAHAGTPPFSSKSGAATDLPKPGDETEDGFTTVVSKKHQRARTLYPTAQLDLAKNPVKTSYYNSVDEITLESPVSAVGASMESIDDFEKEETKKDKSLFPLERRRSSFTSWDEQAEKLAGVNSADKGNHASHILAFGGHNSDASDLSGEDVRRVASPALSSNSGSTSSRAEGSGVGGHRSGQPPPLRPLKAPSITLPSRGKTKKGLGHISSRLHQHSHLSDGSLLYDGYEDESVSSTASDKDSSCGDVRPPHSDRFTANPTMMAFNHDSVPMTSSGPSISRPGVLNYSEVLNIKKNFIDSSSIGNADTESLQRDIWTQRHNKEHLSRNAGFSSEVRQHLGDDYFRSKLDKITDINNPSSVILPPQPPIQRPQLHATKQMPLKSENHMPFKTSTPSGDSWDSWGYFKLENKEPAKRIGIPRSEGWQQDQRSHIFSTSKIHDFSRNSEHYRDSAQPKHDLKTGLHFIPSSKDFASIESETITQIDPWSRPSEEYKTSIHSSCKDTTFSSENSLFSPWMKIPHSSSSSSIHPSSYISSANTLGSRTSQSFLSPMVSPMESGSGVSGLIDSTEDFSSNTHFDHKSPASKMAKDRSFGVSSSGASLKKVQTQTIFSGAMIEGAFDRLEEAETLQEAARKMNLELQKHLSEERAQNEKLKSDLKKLNLKLQILEISGEKLKDEIDQNNTRIEELQVLNQSYITRVDDLEKQFGLQRTELLEQKKLVALQKIDLNKQEAHWQMQNLTAILRQSSSTMRKGLLDAAREKHMEYSSYISECESLKRQAEIKAQRLKDDLQSDANTDLSIDESLPALPQPLSQESCDLQDAAASSSQSQSIFKNGLQFPSIHTSEPVIKVMSSPKAASQPQEAGEEDDDDVQAYLSLIYGNTNNKMDSNSKTGFASTSESSTSSKVGSEDGIDDDIKWDPFYSGPRIPSLNASSGRMGASNQPKLKNATPPSLPPWGVVPGAPRASPPSHLRWQGLQDNGTSTAPPPNYPQQQSRMHSPQKVQPKQHQQHFSSTQQQQQLPYFERVVEAVQDSFPGYSRNAIQNIVDKLRHDCGGTLQGWTYDTLTSQVFEAILDLEENKVLANPFHSAADVHLSNPEAKKKAFDVECSICQLGIEREGKYLGNERGDILTLGCGHRFHEPCIHRWLQSDRSCPNCRSLALLPQEFPSLVQTFSYKHD